MNNSTANIDSKSLQIMSFIYNSLQNGWTIKKRNDNYIFSKKHQGKKEIFDESYLSTFVKQNSKININLE
jgi:hypothetical protein